jgi:hypothetical protein
MYDQLVNQRNRELGHVANEVGGFVRNNVWYGDGDRVYESVPADQQRRAVQFLNEHAFQTPAALVDPDILRRLESNGAADRILNGQKTLLRSLINDNRLKRMAEHATRDRSGAYLPVVMLDDLYDGIWSELKVPSVEIDLYRRNLQRAHVELLVSQVEEKSPSSDLPALARGELQKIAEGIDACAGREKDVTTRYHLNDIKARIVHALDPRRGTGSMKMAGAPGDE